LLTGPEGGFNPAEIELAARAGFMRLSLGPRILRTETAALAAIAILQSLFGDLNRHADRVT
jgi:16S rRNA (uracil1498-N3)-methyltransferase